MATCVMMKGRFPVDKRMNLLSLTWPIFIENMLFMLLGFIDIFVLSRYNDVAASAVSAANQVISICNLVFSIISGATAILISQSLGAEKRQSASMIAALSLLFSTLIGLIVSALIAVFHRPLLAALGAQGDILEYGCEYLLIVGGFIFTQAILNSVTAILRSHGYTRISMYVTAIMNVLNAILDTAFVLGLFGLPSLGVRGVGHRHHPGQGSRRGHLVLHALFPGGIPQHLCPAQALPPRGGKEDFAGRSALRL